jgi:phosphoglycerate dehydrogenase-like enzyme
MRKGLYVLHDKFYNQVYPPVVRELIAQEIEVCGPQLNMDTWSRHREELREAEVILGSWDMPLMDEEFLAAAPNLRAVFYGGGSIKGFVTDAVWDRGIIVTSAYAANAIPTADFTISQILFSLKYGWHFAHQIKAEGSYQKDRFEILFQAPGTYRSSVGIVSLGAIARRVCRLLRHFNVEVIAYDPFVTEQQAADLDVRLCPLEELFAQSGVVSLHAPLLPETVGMITGDHLASMRPFATFINTSRGKVVREEEMIGVLRERPDLQAVLDVTEQEPPEAGSPLYTLPNVTLTPHIAGAIAGNECQLLGEAVLEEVRQYVRGLPQHWAITREKARFMT